MEQDAAMNNFDKLLGRNGELIELRKEQVLAGAMRIIQNHYVNKQNKMEAVAAMFGKKLGERFCIIRYGDRYDARFLERGFEVYGLENPYVDMDAFVLEDLLTGRAEIESDEK